MAPASPPPSAEAESSQYTEGVADVQRGCTAARHWYLDLDEGKGGVAECREQSGLRQAQYS